MLLLIFDAIRLFWRFLRKSLFQDFVSYNFPNMRNRFVMVLIFSLFYCWNGMESKFKRIINGKFSFLSIWKVICRLHKWQQNEELKHFLERRIYSNSSYNGWLRIKLTV